LWCIFKWKVLGAISSMLSLQSFTPVEHYLNTFLKIVEDCKARGIKIIVITPFRMGNSRSDYFARMFSHALEQASIEKSFECLNSWKILSTYPIEKILLIDGFHLTRYAHQILGNALYEKMQKIVTRLEK